MPGRFPDAPGVHQVLQNKTLETFPTNAGKVWSAPNAVKYNAGDLPGICREGLPRPLKAFDTYSDGKTVSQEVAPSAGTQFSIGKVCRNRWGQSFCHISDGKLCPQIPDISIYVGKLFVRCQDIKICDKNRYASGFALGLSLIFLARSPSLWKNLADSLHCRTFTHFCYVATLYGSCVGMCNRKSLIRKSLTTI